MKVVVVGAGAFGCWSAWHLVRAGMDVTLIDPWGPGNSRASSGGESRVIRSVYGADPIYVNMVREAFDIWETWQKEWQSELMQITGSLWLCPDDDSYVRSSRAEMSSNGLSLEEISVNDAARKWPQINFDGIQTVFFEPKSGFLRARKACQIVCDQFVRLGGKLVAGAIEPVEDLEGIQSLELTDGTRIDADCFVIAAGPWMKTLLPKLFKDHLQISRQEVHFFGVPGADASFEFSKLPIWLELSHPIYYGMPAADFRGFKVALDQRGDEFDPTNGDRTPRPGLVEQTRNYIARRFPRLCNAPLIESRVCQYSNTPDGHFVLDQSKSKKIILVGGGCGHGFKMGPTIGRMVSDRLIKNTPFPIEFRLDRFHTANPIGTQFDHRQ